MAQDTGTKILRVAALEYKEGMYAPVLKAFGEGPVAEKIVAMARKHDIDITTGEYDDLLAALKLVKINDSVPPELYMAVARIFAWVFTRKKSN